MEVKHLGFNLLILFSFIIYTNAKSECIYNIYVKTGSFPLAGTQSNISIFLSDDSEAQLSITNLRDWGLTASASDYFNPGEADLFAGKGPCFDGPVCSLIIVLSSYDNWYCEFIEVSTVGFEKGCSSKRFTVNKWLDVDKGSAAILQDECSSSSSSSSSLRKTQNINLISLE